MDPTIQICVEYTTQIDDGPANIERRTVVTVTPPPGHTTIDGVASLAVDIEQAAHADPTGWRRFLLTF